MAYALNDNLSFCDCGGRLVFIDLKIGRYFCLPESWEVDVRRLMSHQLRDHDQFARFDHLVEAGVLERVATGEVLAPAKLSLPDDDLNINGASTSLRSCAASLIAQMWSMSVLRTRAFGTILADLSHRKANTEMASDDAAAAEIAIGFYRSALVFSPADRCLPRSIAFFTLCLRKRIPATLVLGVRLNPFTAHCWVQGDKYLLNDSVENVRLFTPIVAV